MDTDVGTIIDTPHQMARYRFIERLGQIISRSFKAEAKMHFAVRFFFFKCAITGNFKAAITKFVSHVKRKEKTADLQIEMYTNWDSSLGI